MFTNQSFTENKAVINGEMVQIYCSISQPKFIYQRIHPLRDAAFGADCLTPFKILKIIIVGLKMDSGNAITNCVKNSKFHLVKNFRFCVITYFIRNELASPFEGK